MSEINSVDLVYSDPVLDFSHEDRDSHASWRGREVCVQKNSRVQDLVNPNQVINKMGKNVPYMSRPSGSARVTYDEKNGVAFGLEYEDEYKDEEKDTSITVKAEAEVNTSGEKKGEISIGVNK